MKLSEKLKELASKLATMADDAYRDCDCGAYSDDFRELQEIVAALASEAEDQELQALADATHEDYLNDR